MPVPMAVVAEYRLEFNLLENKMAKQTKSRIKLRTANHVVIPVTVTNLRCKQSSPVADSKIIGLDQLKTVGFTVTPDQAQGLITNLSAIAAAGHDAIVTCKRKQTKDDDHHLTVTYKIRE